MSALPMEEAVEEERDEEDRDEVEVRLVAARKALELVLTPDRLPLLEEPPEVAMAGVPEEELPDVPALDCTVELEEDDDELDDPPPPLPERPPRPRPLRLPRIMGAIREA